MLKINGKEIPDAEEFAQGDDHKFYLIRSADERKELTDEGCPEWAIHPIAELPAAWAESCWLRFISSGDLTEHYVLQGDDAEVTVD